MSAKNPVDRWIEDVSTYGLLTGFDGGKGEPEGPQLGQRASAGYWALPAAIRSYMSLDAFMWLSEAEKRTILERETVPGIIEE